MIQADAFSRNECEREYTARIEVRGTISIHIEADSKEDALRQAKVEMDKIEEEGFVELDELEDIEVAYVTKDPPMFRVTRDGRIMQVSHLKPGDLPREPNDLGF